MRFVDPTKLYRKFGGLTAGLQCLCENPPVPKGRPRVTFSRPLRDWTSLVYPTQHCVLGYSQPSLRDWWVLTQTL
jgi:hypothetical protein